MRKTNPTVVVEDNAAARAEAEMLAEERGKSSATVAVLGVLAVVVLLLLVGYFAWWAPVNAAEANENTTPVVQHDTQVIEKPTPSGPTTIVNNPPVTPPTIVTPPSNPPTVVTPPTVIHENHYVPVPVPSTSGNSGSNNNNNTGNGGTNNGGNTTSGDNGSTGQ